MYTSIDILTVKVYYKKVGHHSGVSRWIPLQYQRIRKVFISGQDKLNAEHNN